VDVKEQSQSLRKNGKSFREISSKLKIPLSTVFLWCSQIVLSKRQIERLKQKSLKSLQNGRVISQQKRSRSYLAECDKYFQLGKDMLNTNQNKLLYIGASLYWAEGFKKDKRLGFANSDPIMINFFIHWLITSLKVPRESVRLRLGINRIFLKQTKSITEYWSKITNIPITQFQKPFYQTSKNKRIYPNHNSYRGVLRVRANGQNQAFRMILGMIERLKEELVLIPQNPI
jgi:hypothetical protein